MLRNNPYVLKVGEEGAPRLKLLNKMCNPGSLAFITQQIDLRDKTILDIGCGIAILAAEMAKRSLPNGSVVGIDNSAEQLAVAEKIAAQNNIKNISFRLLSAENIDQLNSKFDFIFCRFVLSHLENAVEVINKLQLLMHEHSILICEEPEDIEAIYCDPADVYADAWKAAALKQQEYSKGDLVIGKRLPNLLSNAKLTTIAITHIQPVMDTPELKQQLWMGLYEIGDLLIRNAYMTHSQLARAIEECKTFATNSVSKVGYFKAIQIASKKTDTKTADEEAQKSCKV